MLENFGIGSKLAGNGLIALDQVKAQMGCCQFKAIFMDINMPVMDGYESTRQIIKYLKAIEAERGCSIEMPVIVALTANTTQEERNRCTRSGMTTFLGKPPEPSELRRVLTSIFGEERLSFEE